MRSVLHIISGLSVGGAETALAEVAGSLRSRDWNQHVVSLTGRGALADVLVERGVPVTTFDMRSPLAWPAALARLAALVRRMRPDIIQGWMYHGNFAAALVHRLAPNGTRLCWNLRASNMDDARYLSIVDWGRRLSHWPDAIVVNSYAGANFHLKRGFRPRRLEIIQNGIDTSRFRPNADVRVRIRQELGLASDTRLAIHVARVDPMKDHALLLAVLRQCPLVQCILVGNGTDRLDLPPNAKSLAVRLDVADLNAAADLVLSTSAFGEGFSNTIAEGMSAGLVPIATDVGDAALIVGETGRVVPPGEAGLFAEALRAEVSLPRAELQSGGLAARARIENLFSVDRSVQAYESLYSQL